MTTEIDHLTQDDPIPGQNWVCISFLSPEGLKNCTTRGLKIRGVYETKDQAESRASEIQKKDPHFHVFVGEIGKWLPWDPDVNSIKDHKFLEKELNEIHAAYTKNLELMANQEKSRKADMIHQAAVSEQQKLNNPTKSRLQKKLAAKKNMEKISKQAEKLPDLSKSDDLNKLESEINNKQKNLESIDSKLAKAQELYNQIYKKN